MTGIVETVMNVRDVMRIESYDVNRNDRNRDVMIKNTLRGIVVEETRGESTWMAMNNGKVNVKFGVVQKDHSSYDCCELTLFIVVEQFTAMK